VTTTINALSIATALLVDDKAAHLMPTNHNIANGLF
jgi:hypothetical protein